MDGSNKKQRLNSEGLSKTTLDTLESYVQKGNYYEAHQMLKSVHFRMMRSKQFGQLLPMLKDGILTFLAHCQFTIVNDLIKSLFESLEARGDVDEPVADVRLIAELHRSILTSKQDLLLDDLVRSALRWAERSEGLINHAFATNYANSKRYQEAVRHFLLAPPSSAANFASLVIQAEQDRSSDSESSHGRSIDIITCLLRLIYNDKLKMAASLLDHYVCEQHLLEKKKPPYEWPLLNFAWLLISAVEVGRPFAAFEELTSGYKRHTDCDPSLSTLIAKIGDKKFRRPQRSNQPNLGQLIQTMFSVGATQPTTRPSMPDDLD